MQAFTLDTEETKSQYNHTDAKSFLCKVITEHKSYVLIPLVNLKKLNCSTSHCKKAK